MLNVSHWNASDWLGVYGAALATLLAFFRAIAWFRDRRSRIIVAAYDCPGQVEPSKTWEQGVAVRVVNRSDYSVRIRVVGFQSKPGLGLPPGQRRIGFTFAPSGPNLPADLRPQDSLDFFFPYRELERNLPALFTRMMRVSVELTTGERFRSRRVQATQGSESP